MGQGERWTPIYDRMFDPEHELKMGQPRCPAFAFSDLIHNARWEDGTRIVGGVVVRLKRGELVASIRWMAERWTWSRGRVERFLALLQDPSVTKIETVRETPAGTVYRIVSYETYANPWDSSEAAKRDANRPQTSHPRATPRAKEQQGHHGHHGSSTSFSRPKKKSKGGETLPDDWKPTETHQLRAGEFGLELQDQVERFRNHAAANRRLQFDWNASFTNWLLTARDIQARHGGNGKHAAAPDPLDILQDPKNSTRWMEIRKELERDGVGFEEAAEKGLEKLREELALR